MSPEITKTTDSDIHFYIKTDHSYTEHYMFLRIPINSYVFFCHKKMNTSYTKENPVFIFLCSISPLSELENNFSLWRYFKTFFPSIINIKKSVLNSSIHPQTRDSTCKLPNKLQ